MMKDFYYILGVEADSNPDTIKEAYRKLSKKLHPDLNQGDEYFENRFKDVKEAFETLRDPAKRAKYDEAYQKMKPASIGQENIWPKDRANPAHFTKFKRKGPGIGMTIVLILMTLIIGDYLVRTFGAPKLARAYAATPPASPARSTLAYHAGKKHKKKHNLKNKIAADPAKHSFDTVAVTLVKPMPIKTELTKPVPVRPILVKPEPVKLMANKDGSEADGKGNFLYATYVLPNVTGVINLRAYNKYDSSIVATIPARAKVLVLEKGNTYYRVFYNNAIGYVPKWALQAK